MLIVSMMILINSFISLYSLMCTIIFMRQWVKLLYGRCSWWQIISSRLLLSHFLLPALFIRISLLNIIVVVAGAVTVVIVNIQDSNSTYSLGLCCVYKYTQSWEWIMYTSISSWNFHMFVTSSNFSSFNSLFYTHIYILYIYSSSQSFVKSTVV